MEGDRESKKRADVSKDSGHWISVLSLIFSIMAITVSLSILGWQLANSSPKTTLNKSALEEIIARLKDIEEEHDHLLENRHEAVKSIMTPLPPFCLKLPDPGPCTDLVSRWYYLAHQEDCVQFPWGGCQGNMNNFLSLAQCRAACQVPLEKHRLTQERKAQLGKIGSKQVAFSDSNIPSLRTNFTPADCTLPPDAGPCQDRVTRFYSEDEECKRFEYGGCSGNMNNFFSEEECQRHCRTQESLKTSLLQNTVNDNEDLLKRRGRKRKVEYKARPRVNSCTLPPNPGDCPGNSDKIRWHWDLQKGDCLPLEYTGCGGNSNNFITREKCFKRCNREI